ncbi:hypothetical protein GCM10023169_30710 [Georgenia halophila]|uniref:DUF1330 domain-containing protein n=1 Tax=Georgenia halophila TaxID=620889 RepID=A0ABP8LFZ3_9MICO
MTAATTQRRAYVVGYLEDVAMGPEIVAYMARIESTFEPFGGEWVVHGTTPQVVEGVLRGDVVIIGFPSLAEARAWYESSAYQSILELRTRNCRSIVMMLEGVPAGYEAAETIASLPVG